MPSKKYLRLTIPTDSAIQYAKDLVKAKKESAKKEGKNVHLMSINVSRVLWESFMEYNKRYRKKNKMDELANEYDIFLKHFDSSKTLGSRKKHDTSFS